MARKGDGEVIIDITADDSEFKKTLESTGKSAAVVTAALVAIGTAAINVSTKFDAAFAKTQTIMDTTAMSAQDMRQDILDLSATSGMAATDVSEAVYQAISGSVATADAANFVSEANQLAVAGFTSLTNATDVLTTTLNAYGLEADAVSGISNVLIQTQNLGKTSVDELSASMGKAISTGSAYGVGLTNLSAAYVELTKGGIATAEATTYISGMLNELGKSSSKVGKIIQEKTGKSFGQLMQDGWSLADVLDVLMQSVDGNSEALMQLWSSQEAGKAANALAVQGFDDFNNVLAKMEREMDGAATTTKDAYSIMTDTSEFVNMRFRNSVTNLGIAIGDQLTPALDDVKIATAGILEGATKVINENPAIVAGITGITAAAGTLAVVITGLLVIEKVKKAMEAFNATLLTNPIMLAATAVAGLAAYLITLGANAKNACPEVEALTASTERLNETVATGKEELADSAAQIDGTASKAEEYLDKLDKLEQQGLKTADSHREYSDTIELLKALLPDLNIELDEETGLLKEGTGHIREQIIAWKDLAYAQAYQQKYKDALSGILDGEKKLADSQEKLENLTGSSAYKNLTEQIEEYDRQLQSGLITERSYAAVTGELYRELRPMSKEIGALEAAISDQNESLAESREYLAWCEEGYKQYAGTAAEVAAQQQAQAEATQAQAEAAAEYTQKLTDVQTALSAYGASFADAGISITGFSEILAASGVTADEAAAGIEDYRDRVINSTDEISQKSMSDMEMMIKNMQQRTETYKSWNNNLAKLQVQYGNQLSDDFLDFVRGLGPEYNGVLEEWLNGNTASMTELQTAVEEGGKTAVQCYKGEYEKLPTESERITKENVRKTMEAINPMADGFRETGATSGMELLAGTQEAIGANLPGLEQYTETAGTDVGYQFSAGTATGIRNGEYLVVSAAQDVAKAAVRASRQTLQINSPSRIGEKDVGYWWPAGVAEGIEKGTGLVVDAARTQAFDLAHASEEFLASARDATMPTIPAPAYYQDAGQTPTLRGSAQLQATLEVPVYLDGREIARSTAHYMGEQMEFEVM